MTPNPSINRNVKSCAFRRPVISSVRPQLEFAMAETTTVLELVLASSAQLSAWALAVTGGTVAAIVSTSYRRPEHLSWRLPFLLFIPGWSCIAYSLYAGNNLVGRFLASRMVQPERMREISSKINDLYDDQRNFLLYSLAFFGLWLIIYLITWTFTDEFRKGDGK